LLVRVQPGELPGTLFGAASPAAQLAFIQRRLASVGSRLSLIGSPIALLAASVALLGGTVALVGGAVALVGGLVPVVGGSVALVGELGAVGFLACFRRPETLPSGPGSLAARRVPRRSECQTVRGFLGASQCSIRTLRAGLRPLGARLRSLDASLRRSTGRASVGGSAGTPPELRSMNAVYVSSVGGFAT
jgi:hypothetical protein